MTLPSEYLQKGFCQHVFATDDNGNPAPQGVSPDEFFGFKRTHFSILGAINEWCQDDDYFDGTYNRVIKETLHQICGPGHHHTDNIWLYNNHPNRTQAEVVELMQTVESNIGLNKKDLPETPVSPIHSGDDFEICTALHNSGIIEYRPNLANIDIACDIATAYRYGLKQNNSETLIEIGNEMIARLNEYIDLALYLRDNYVDPGLNISGKEYYGPIVRADETEDLIEKWESAVRSQK